MDKEKFLTQLREKLYKVPEEERNNAIKYYEEYFEEAGEENEQSVIESLGSPSEVAAKIMMDLALKETDKENPKKRFSSVWMVILAIFASPIALQIAIVLITLLLVLVILLLSVLLMFGVLGIALFLSGFLTFILSFYLLWVHFPTAIFFFGYAFLAIGLGGVFIFFTKFLSQKSFTWLLNMMNKLLKRRTKNNEK